ncbi:hypothetical protein DPMN_119891 [Dreissena polymorpha]|uniref:Uncharacterized protein n=2 Tax=Dreissena polymorpha TaxID=45954 RepID=A0A9D4GK11_DREPO|nr:hypothetical protein DPMN_119891 [Dreissena polymorpha]
MSKILGLLCALLFVGYTEAVITGFTGTSPAGTMTVAGTATAATSTISLQSSLASGATLFTVTAAAGDTINTYAFHTTNGNPGTYGAIAKVGTAGVVTLAKALDYATTKEVVFIVVATDTASTPNTGSMTVTVKFGPSTHTAYSFCVADPTALGAVIGTPSSSVSTAVWTVAAGGTDAAKFTVASGVIKTAAILQSSDKIHYTADLTLTDGTATSTWPLHVLVGNTCLNSGVSQVVTGLAMILITVLAIHVV